MVHLAQRSFGGVAKGERMIDALAGSLDGISVVALATNIPGPLALARLRALGAQVTKVEPMQGDPLAHASPQWYGSIVTGINVLQLDLRDAASIATIDALLRDADVFISATRATVLERLALTWAMLHARYPKVVHVAVCGEAPPNDSRAGHDLTYQARAGTIAAPAMPRALVGDMAAAERVVASVLGALLLRERTGRCARVDVSIVQAATDFAEPFRYGLTAGDGALGGALPAYSLYRARDAYVAVAALEPHFIERLKTLLGVSDLTREAIAGALIQRDAAAWEEAAHDADVPLAAVR